MTIARMLLLPSAFARTVAQHSIEVRIYHIHRMQHVDPSIVVLTYTRPPPAARSRKRLLTPRCSKSAQVHGKQCRLCSSQVPPSTTAYPTTRPQIHTYHARAASVRCVLSPTVVHLIFSTDIISCRPVVLQTEQTQADTEFSFTSCFCLTTAVFAILE